MKATIYDVAREAGVSIATVSKVINEKGKISEERRREIFAIMERLQYRPSVIASALTGKHTYTLGLLIPDIANPFFAELARAVEDRGHQLGYSVIICSTDNQDDRIGQYVSMLKQKQVDGMMIGTGMTNADLLRDISAAMPTVVLGREVPAFPVHTVVAGDFGGGGLAARHLLQLGHRHMAVLAEDETISSSRERVRGFKQTLEDSGISLPERDVLLCRHRMEDGKRVAAGLLSRTDRPTAVFCCNDLLAVGALQAAKEAGIRVPEELSVVSFDNTILASVTDPPLTSIAQPIELLGAGAVDLLIKEFERAQPAKERIELRTELIVRGSTAANATFN